MAESKILANVKKIVEVGGKISFKNNGSLGGVLVTCEFPGCQPIGSVILIKDFVEDTHLVETCFGLALRMFKAGELSPVSPVMNCEQKDSIGTQTV